MPFAPRPASPPTAGCARGGTPAALPRSMDLLLDRCRQPGGSICPGVASPVSLAHSVGDRSELANRGRRRCRRDDLAALRQLPGQEADPAAAPGDTTDASDLARPCRREELDVEVER